MLSTHARFEQGLCIHNAVETLGCGRYPAVYKSSLGLTYAPFSANTECSIVQRFNFQYAASTPAVRHASVIPVGPADGMMMKVA